MSRRALELDLWGRVRRESEAAKDRYRASAADLASGRLAVAAEVANDYFSVRELEAEYDLITNTITTYQRSLDLTQNRRRGDGAVLPLPGPASPARDSHLSRPAQHRDLLNRYRLLRLQDPQA